MSPRAPGETPRASSDSRPSLKKSFTRSQISSFLATMVDFGTLALLVEVLKLWYVPAVTVGAAFGAVTHFSLGRYWSFEARDGHWVRQARRYALVSAGGALLNTGLVYASTEGFDMNYLVSKTFVSILVGIFFNFPLHRGYVFR